MSSYKNLEHIVDLQLITQKVQQVEENLKELHSQDDEKALKKAFQHQYIQRLARRKTLDDFKVKHNLKILKLDQMRKKLLTEIDEKRDVFY